MKWSFLHKGEVNQDSILSVLLENRGLTGKKEVHEFLEPSLSGLTVRESGLDEKECYKAFQRIKKAIKNQESVVVYTDYDVDGISSGAIIWETLFSAGCRVMPYVPHRVEEGYGLSKKGIDRIKKDFAASLIITVDHGINAQREVKYAKDAGMETVILDHHLLPSQKPEAVAIIHTTKMAASGVAWIFAQYFQKMGNKEKTLKEGIAGLELAALGTIADLVPLIGPNRIIVKYGLSDLRKTRRLGLLELIKRAGLKPEEIETYEVSHILSPRINAMGRMAHALDALRLICTKDKERAEKISQLLNETNRERQLITEESVNHALETIRQERNILKSETSPNLLFVGHKTYKQGVIGLIAGRLTEKFGRPSIVLSIGEEYSKASARSVAGFNIVEAIKKASFLLQDVGGHPMAAGFTVATKNIEGLKKELGRIFNDGLKEKLVKTLTIEAEVEFDSLTVDLLKKIELLAPFGMGNYEPVLASTGVEVAGIKRVGAQGKHLKTLLRSSSQKKEGLFEAIGFGMGDWCSRIEKGSFIDIAYTLARDKWKIKNGMGDFLQLKLKDVTIRKTASP